MTTPSSVISVRRSWQALRRPDETNQLFIDHMMLAFTAHVAQAYGGLRRITEPPRGGLAPWQAKRACERLEADLGGKLPLEHIAAEFGLSVSHFSRAFRISTGLPPHQWLLRQRVRAAKQLMTVRDLPLSEIAISAGFANQSHFTRVFSDRGRRQPGRVAPRNAQRAGKRVVSDDGVPSPGSVATGARHMTQTGLWGQTVGKFLRLEHAPPSLITRSLRGVEVAVTETRNDNPVPGVSGPMPLEDAFIVSLKFHDYPDCELWERGKCVTKADVRAGATYLYDMKRDPRYVIDKPFHSLHFYLPRSALDGIAEQSGHGACRSTRLSARHRP